MDPSGLNYVMCIAVLFFFFFLFHYHSSSNINAYHEMKKKETWGKVHEFCYQYVRFA